MFPHIILLTLNFALRLLLIVTSLGCLNLTALNDVCAEFGARRLFLHSLLKGGKFPCAHLKSEFELLKRGILARSCSDSGFFNTVCALMDASNES